MVLEAHIGKLGVFFNHLAQVAAAVIIALITAWPAAIIAVPIIRIAFPDTSERTPLQAEEVRPVSEP
jgi:hypothetical protein